MPNADLVIEGGGVKGLGAFGAATRLLEAGYKFPRVAGTSVGALTAAFLAAGIKVEELSRVLDRLDVSRIPDRRTPIPLVGEGMSLFRNLGAHPGDYIHDWLHRELKKLGKTTFADFRRSDPGDDKTIPAHQRYSLVVMTTDITNGRLLRLPWDYDLFHLDPDKQSVADAVRASLSIPFYFEPCKLRDPKTGDEAVLVDGAVLSNFPVEIFDRMDGKPRRWPTFGIRLLPDLPADMAQLFPVFALPMFPPLQLVQQIVSTAIVGRDQTHLSRPEVRDRTLIVDTSGVGITEFTIDRRRRRELIGRGWAAADRFLHRWHSDSPPAALPATARESATRPAKTRKPATATRAGR